MIWLLASMVLDVSRWLSSVLLLVSIDPYYCTNHM